MIFFVALPFTAIEDGLAPDQAVECPSGAAAIAGAELVKESTKSAYRGLKTAVATLFGKRAESDLRP